MKKATMAFVYKWTQLSTNKWYVGSRTAIGCHPEDGYITSSKIVKPMIVEDQSDWSREILVIGESKYISKIESDLLKALDAMNDPMSFNMHNGDGNFTMTGATAWNKGKTKQTDVRIAQYAESTSKSILSRDSTKAWNKGRKPGCIAWNKGKTGLKVKQVSCPHCQKVGGLNAMNRWHFDNCKKTEVVKLVVQDKEKRV